MQEYSLIFHNNYYTTINILIYNDLRVFNHVVRCTISFLRRGWVADYPLILLDKPFSATLAFTRGFL